MYRLFDFLGFLVWKYIVIKLLTTVKNSGLLKYTNGLLKYYVFLK